MSRDLGTQYARNAIKFSVRSVKGNIFKKDDPTIANYSVSKQQT
jgi:hypothetical protein